MPETFDVMWTEPERRVSYGETFDEACAIAVTQSARAGVPTEFRYGGYVYVVNAAKHDEDVRDA